MTLSVCLIVKNEEENIVRCLKSVEFADEIIIVDTGSTDKTKELCLQFPKVKLYDYYKYPDGIKISFRFDEARNYSLSLATMETILVMDADEELQNFEELNMEYDVGLINVVNREGEVFTTNHEARYFKNGIGIYYSNPVHEETSYSIKKNGLKLCKSGVRVRHYGYEGLTEEDRNNKSQYVINEMKKYTSKDFPGGGYNWILAGAYMSIADYSNFVRYAVASLSDEINNDSKAAKCNHIAICLLIIAPKFTVKESKKISALLKYFIGKSIEYQSKQVQAYNILLQHLIDSEEYELAQECLNKIKINNDISDFNNDIILTKQQILQSQKLINNGRSI